MPAPSSRREPVTVISVARDLIADPCKVFLFNWNWKAGLLSGMFRAALFALNWNLMRRGLMLTGSGTDSLATDFRRLPAILGDLLMAGPRALARVLRGDFA